jgi:uncharacterized protein
MYQTDLHFIKQQAEKLEDENESFRSWLKMQDAGDLDLAIMQLNAEVEPGIDCRKCGNCCRSYMINVEPEEIAPLSQLLGMRETELKSKFIETGNDGRMIVNKIPCHFLKGNECSVYEARFSGCREFPHLDKPGFQQRLFSIFMYYSVCPIIYNVLELMKERTMFNNHD